MNLGKVSCDLFTKLSWHTLTPNGVECNTAKKSIAAFFFFFRLKFTLCKAKQPLQGIDLQEKEAQKD